MTTLPRDIATSTRILASIVIVSVLALAGSPPVGAQARSTAAVTVIGAGPTGHTAWEVIGRIDQVGGSFTAYGYLTAVPGVPAALLVGNPVKHTEASAHLTLIMHGRLLSRSVVGNLFVLNVTGSATVHVRASGVASFTRVASFARGPAIAGFVMDLQSIVNVQAPNKGILQVSGDFQQTSAATFNLAGHSYQLGRTGQRERLLVSGEGIRIEPTAPRASFVFAGNTTIAGT